MKRPPIEDLPFFPTIRITMQCTQTCGHCGFACSPHETTMMTVDTAKNVHQFLFANIITQINVMGGEFWLNPDWEAIILILSQNCRTRIVTNGDWYPHIKIRNRIKSLLQSHPNLYLSISNDQFHTNQYVSQVESFCQKHAIRYTIECDVSTEGIVPVRRGHFHAGFFAGFSMYCLRKRTSEGFLIDETGEIFRCPFGIWDMGDNVSNYLTGGWKARWIEILTAFRKTHIMSCMDCDRVHASVQYQIQEKAKCNSIKN